MDQYNAYEALPDLHVNGKLTLGENIADLGGCSIAYEALQRASGHVCGFMLKQARPKDVELFVAMAKLEPTSPDKLPLRVVVPGFIISELRTAFQMGFLILVPFILIDLVVSTVLMSMGMMMLPPATISMPLKILLFVLVDGWALIVRSLVMSFGS